MARSYLVLFHEKFPDDLSSLPRDMARRILKTVEQRLSQAPDLYGERLRKSLRGFWKLRVGDYRVVYVIVGQEVRGYGVMHRREVYELIVNRLSGPWKGTREGKMGETS